MRGLRYPMLGLALAALLLPAAAAAHSDDELDARPTPHGGQLRMAGALHLELVLARDGDATQPRAVVVHVTNHADDPQPTAAARAAATLLAAGSKPVRVTLTPAGETRLEGSAIYPNDPALKAVVEVTLPDQPTEQARFTPLAPRPAADAHEHDGHQHDHRHDHRH